MPTLAGAIQRVAPLHRSFVLLAQSSDIPSTPSDVVFERVREREIDAVLSLSKETPDELRLMHKRFARGHWCTCGRVGGVPAFYAWLMVDEIEIGAELFPLPMDYVYSYKVFTAPPFRRQGIAASYYTHLRHSFPARRRLLSTVAAGDRSSLALHAQCGFHRFGSLWKVRGMDSPICSAQVTHLLADGTVRYDTRVACP